jgi:DNA-directed RNA polymerase specialized sigma24 family protein
VSPRPTLVRHCYDGWRRGGWLTTVITRVCLDMLRSRTSRREEPLGDDLPEPPARRADGTDPERIGRLDLAILGEGQ